MQGKIEKEAWEEKKKEELRKARRKEKKKVAKEMMELEAPPKDVDKIEEMLKKKGRGLTMVKTPPQPLSLNTNRNKRKGYVDLALCCYINTRGQLTRRAYINVKPKKQSLQYYSCNISLRLISDFVDYAYRLKNLPRKRQELMISKLARPVWKKYARNKIPYDRWKRFGEQDQVKKLNEILEED